MLAAAPELPRGERIKLLDFGAAKLPQDPGADGAWPQPSGGNLVGTPQYMSPEQCRRSRHVDGQADVYSLGVLLYRMLTGRLPFVAEGRSEVMAMHIFSPPPSMTDQARPLPAPLVQLVLRMLAKLADGVGCDWGCCAFSTRDD